MKARERFEVSDGGGGLTLAYRDGYKTPVWRLCYRIGGKRGSRDTPGAHGKARVLVLGSYSDLSLAKARATAKDLRARVRLGHEVAAEKQEREREAGRNVYTVAKLADEYFERNIVGRWKHPNIVRSRIEKDIKPAIGKLPVRDVGPSDIDKMLQGIVKRGAPTIANDVLRWTRRMFKFAIKREKAKGNPPAAFELSDGGRHGGAARAGALARRPGEVLRGHAQDTRAVRRERSYFQAAVDVGCPQDGVN